ncbi:unnamed protein product [Dracunculus medinensis]|uniref:Uncharacterized protein n=1 Tax=Dracunculus medinensis TaxID=318479 RepID=A0A0N4U4X0_DRAME|nr:unnamed protein product [Dracunculus medinensis]
MVFPLLGRFPMLVDLQSFPQQFILRCSISEFFPGFVQDGFHIHQPHSPSFLSVGLREIFVHCEEFPDLYISNPISPFVQLIVLGAYIYGIDFALPIDLAL